MMKLFSQWGCIAQGCREHQCSSQAEVRARPRGCVPIGALQNVESSPLGYGDWGLPEGGGAWWSRDGMGEGGVHLGEGVE